MEKPPILSDEKIKDIQRECEVMQYVGLVERGIATAQLDADVAYYEHWYGKLLEDYKEVKTERAELLDKIQQAKAEVAREILEVYDRYIKVLGEEIDTLSPLAISHGWRSVRTEAGNKCRADIQEVKSKYGGQK